jgi:hypothetical protein
MRSVLFAIAFAISVSSTALAQQAVVHEPQSSRLLSAASYIDRGDGWLKKGEFERAIADYTLASVFDAGHANARLPTRGRPGQDTFIARLRRVSNQRKFGERNVS